MSDLITKSQLYTFTILAQPDVCNPYKSVPNHIKLCQIKDRTLKASTIRCSNGSGWLKLLIKSMHMHHQVDDWRIWYSLIHTPLFDYGEEIIIFQLLKVSQCSPRQVFAAGFHESGAELNKEECMIQ